MSKSTLQRLLVKDIIERPFFQQATVIANDKALERTVTWVHIMEITNVGQLLNGNELILSTGIAWQNDEQLCLSFLRQLIDKGVAGLVVELVNFAKKLPDSVIQLAKSHNFPLILFYEEVRYIDITQDLHSLFLHQHHQMVSKLEKLSIILNNSFLSGKGIVSLLKDFHRFTSLDVMLFPRQGNPIFVPACSSELKNKYFKKWKEDSHKFILSFPQEEVRSIDFLGQTFAFLFVRLKATVELTEFETLALERGATAVAQEVMRTMYYEEQKKHKEDTWVQSWLTEEIEEGEVRTKLHQIIGKDIPEKFLTVISEIEDNDKDKTDSHYLSNLMVARSFFEDRGFKLVLSTIRNHIVFLLFPPQHMTLGIIHKEIMEVFERLQKGVKCYFGNFSIGQYTNKLTKAVNSYESAKVVLRIQNKLGTLGIPAYEQLHGYRVIAMMEENDSLEDYVEYYLGDIKTYTQENGRHLLRTLKYYLLYNGKKKETAESLYIVRQTLYHRLNKIEKVIGNIFSSPERRLALELAIMGYEYLYGSLDED